ncbi:MAG: tetratricopeptide repeat protein [Rhodospirillales bacterium]
MANDEAKRKAIRLYKAGSLKEALAAARQAAEADARDAAIRNFAGAIALEIGDAATAVSLLSESLHLNRGQAPTHYLIGNAFSRLALYEQAVDSYKEALVLNPRQPDALVNLGIAYRSLRKHSEAERNLRQALDIDPDHPEANHGLALVLDTKSQSDRAEPFARRAVELDHSKIEFVITYGNILRNLRKYADAERVFKAALEYKPNDPSLLCSVGTVLREQNLFDAATEHYERALELAPKSASVLRNAADYFRSKREHERARDAYERLIEVVGDSDIGAFNNLAITLRDLDRFDDAEAMYKKCIELDDDNAYGFNNLAILLMEMGKGKESIEYYQKALDHKPDYKGARSNMMFYMNYLSEYSPQELYEAHREFQRFHVAPEIPGSVYHPNQPDPERKLKIGYLSADFYGHAVSYFIDAALKYHDKENFEVTCYAHVPTPDAITERLKNYVENFRFIHQVKDDELAQIIRDDGIDILVDLAGHTAGNRIDVLALRPAPIQVTWIGYPNTTGLDAVDYRFVDSITDPPGLADEVHSETLWRLPKVFTCYTPSATEEVNTTPPVVKNGYITFGSFNNASKISKLTVESWAKLLHAVPGSRLLLKSASLADNDTCERFKQRFAKQGIDEDRIELHGRMSSSEHMRFYDRVDIGVDPIPYNGTTTSCEALWMGVPIVTFAGDRHAARVTASLLHQVGLGDLVGETLDEYVDKATALAADVPRLTKIREELRERMRQSPLCDGPGHTRDVEQAYREMWRIWCDEADARKAERAKRGWPAEGPYYPPMRLLNGLGNGHVVQIKKALGCMEGTYLLSDAHPLGIRVFPPIHQAKAWHNLFDELESEVVSKRDIGFKEAIFRIYKNVADRDGIILIHPWNHLDFVAVPFLPTPTYLLDTNTALEKYFEINQVFLARHPIGQWSDYLNDTIVGQHIGPEEFLRGYRKYAEFAAEGRVFKVEEFADDPDRMLRDLCDALDLKFDPTYVHRWFVNTHVTGDAQNRILGTRMYEVFEKPIEAKLPAAHLDIIKGNADYAAILDLLGYADDYPVKAESDTIVLERPHDSSKIDEPVGITELPQPHQVD